MDHANTVVNQNIVYTFQYNSDAVDTVAIQTVSIMLSKRSVRRTYCKFVQNRIL